MKNLCDFKVITSYMQRYSKNTVKDEFCCMGNEQTAFSTQLKIIRNDLYISFTKIKFCDKR